MKSSPSPRISHRNLPQRFLKARESLMHHFRPILKHYGLTDQQWRILRLLDEYVQMEPHALCEQCQIHSASMAGMLARMEEQQLVLRGPVERDLRRVSVRLAPKGEQLVIEIAPLIDLQYLLIEEALGKHVLENLFDSLETFIAAQDNAVQLIELPSSD
jgi:homoprotocatechuate degradation regulator HpaR